jgi:hypothetical protein
MAPDEWNPIEIPIRIEAWEWASNPQNGITIPQVMYPFVGAIDKKHKHTIDLGYDSMKLATVLRKGDDFML